MNDANGDDDAGRSRTTTTTTMAALMRATMASDVADVRVDDVVVRVTSYARRGGGKRSSRARIAEARCGTAAAAEDVARAARTVFGLMDAAGARRRRALVIVNPVSGRGGGGKMWERSARGVLERAGVTCDATTTEGPGDATRIVREADMGAYDCVVLVGGDGTVAEAYQGLCEREDAREVRARVTLGVVPAGSGNALCKSIQAAAGETCDPVSCALTIARGMTRALDRCEVRFMDGMTGTWSETRTTHSLLSTSWGFFSDVDIESERFRRFGGMRFTMQAIVRIVARRKYQCDLLYETTPEGEAHNARDALGAPGELVPGRPGWRKISGETLGMWALNVPWGTECTFAAPRAAFDDGSIDIVLVQAASRKSMLKLLLDFDSGRHVNHRAVRYFKAKSFELIPGPSSSAKSGGYIAIDGEVAARRHDPSPAMSPYGPLRCDVHRAEVRVFAPTPAIE